MLISVAIWEIKIKAMISSIRTTKIKNSDTSNASDNVEKLGHSPLMLLSGTHNGATNLFENRLPASYKIKH